jgi:Protein of unknown function (DUF1501)
MMSPDQFRAIQSRRRFLQQAGYGFGTIGLAHVLAQDGRAATADPLAAKAPHFPGKAKSVIFLFMGGGPSQMDLFHPKPRLNEYNGKPLPDSLQKDLAAALAQRPNTSPDSKVFGSPWQFKKYGQSGMDFSDLVPHMASVADDWAMVRSVQTDVLNHTPAEALLMGGSPQFGRPSFGAWTLYGLGSETEDLPGYVVLTSQAAVNGSENWTSGFLPAMYRGVELRGSGDPILFLSNPPGLTAEMQRNRLDALRDLNQMRHAATGDLEIASRIYAYELAFRMQTSGPELADLSKESAATKDMYGLNDKADETPAEPADEDMPRRRGNSVAYARNCLLARRLVERGVRCVMLVHYAWDHHSNLAAGIKSACRETDKPTAALIKDLKQRGMLDNTLVVWGGEFGRTSVSELRRPDAPQTVGRNHFMEGFTVLLAGGGIKPGAIIGDTDEFALHITEDRVHVHDLHATMLHCLGLDHKKLTYRYMGRDFRLTDTAGNVVPKLLA